MLGLVESMQGKPGWGICAHPHMGGGGVETQREGGGSKVENYAVQYSSQYGNQILFK